MGIEVKASVRVTDIGKARQLVTAALSADKCKVMPNDAFRISATRGSQLKMRAIGGMLVDMKVLPVYVQVTFIEDEGAGTVQVDARDDLGFGLMVGMETKYNQAVHDIAFVVTNSVAGITVTPEPIGKAFCTRCGAKLEAEMNFCSKCGSAA